MWILFECISKIYDEVLTYPLLDFQYNSTFNWPALANTFFLLFY